MTLKKSDNPQRALDASVEVGRIIPTLTPHLYSPIEAREQVGCSPSTLRNYVHAWEEAFGPLPRSGEGQILLSDSLACLFQLIYELPTELKQDGLRIAMHTYGREHPEVLLEIAREYNTSTEITHGKAEFVNSLLLFTHGNALHEQREVTTKQQEEAKERGRTESDHAEAIAELQEWAEEANTFLLVLTKLVRKTFHAGEQHLDRLLSQTRLNLPHKPRTSSPEQPDGHELSQ